MDRKIKKVKFKKAKFKGVLLSIIAVGLIFFIVDIIRIESEQNPIFSVPVAFYKDGGSVDYIGLFYTVKKQVVDYEMALIDEKGGFHYQLAPWLLPRVVLAQSDPTQNLNIRLELEQNIIGSNQSESSFACEGPTGNLQPIESVLWRTGLSERHPNPVEKEVNGRN